MFNSLQYVETSAPNFYLMLHFKKYISKYNIIFLLFVLYMLGFIYLLDDHGSEEKSNPIQENNDSVSSSSQETGKQNILFFAYKYYRNIYW